MPELQRPVCVGLLVVTSYQGAHWEGGAGVGRLCGVADDKSGWGCRAGPRPGSRLGGWAHFVPDFGSFLNLRGGFLAETIKDTSKYGLNPQTLEGGRGPSSVSRQGFSLRETQWPGPCVCVTPVTALTAHAACGLDGATVVPAPQRLGEAQPPGRWGFRVPAKLSPGSFKDGVEPQREAGRHWSPRQDPHPHLLATSSGRSTIHPVPPERQVRVLSQVTGEKWTRDGDLSHVSQ